MKKKPIRSWFLALASLILAGGLVAAIFLTTQEVKRPERKELRTRASVPQGEVEVSLSPSEGTFYVSPEGVGQEGTTEIVLTTPTAAEVSTVQIYLSYEYAGSSPAMDFGSQLEVPEGLFAPNDVIKNEVVYDETNKRVELRFSAFNVNGVTLSGRVVVARINWRVIRGGETVRLEFDSFLSRVFQAGQPDNDILQTPPVPGASYSTAVDLSAPAAPVVSDDGEVTESSTQLHASWTASDAESGVVSYEYGIGTAPGVNDVVGWTATEDNEVVHSGLNLQQGVVYYFNVRAKNGVGLWSEVGSSNGIRLTNPVSWVSEDERVGLEADDFWLEAGGESYFDNTADLTIHSDPGWATYTTLEATWHEKGREMKVFMYFQADENSWWVSEIRTYNGETPGDWIYYTGPFFQTPLNQSFVREEVDLVADDSNPIAGELHFRNLRLTVNFTQQTGLRLKVRFQGIGENQPIETVKKATVRLKQGTEVVYEEEVNFEWQPDGTWVGETLSQIPLGTYDVLVKGWAHLQKKVAEGITLQAGENEIVYTYPPLLAGDIAGEPGTRDYNMVDALDLALLIYMYDPEVSGVHHIADLNLDGEVEALDLATLISNYEPGVHGDE